MLGWRDRGERRGGGVGSGEGRDSERQSGRKREGGMERERRLRE